MTKTRRQLATTWLLAALGCAAPSPDTPPEVHYGDSICARCGMILDDGRYVTATMIQSDRGSEARLFDDFNCQLAYEDDDSTLVIVRRWVHDHESLDWIDASAAFYVRSPTLRTPMASGIAAFARSEAADDFARRHDGEVVVRFR